MVSKNKEDDNAAENLNVEEDKKEEEEKER
jgi:hypothetical protein